MTAPIRIVGDKTPTPYQARIIASLAQAMHENRSGAIMAPTGSGKSLIAAAGVEVAIEIKKPILVLHPDVSLLRQNLAQFRTLPVFRDARASVFTAQNEKFDDPVDREDLSAEVSLATNMSLVNKIERPAFLAALDDFGRRGGLVLIDEGHKAAAEKLSAVLSRIAAAGGMGVVLTATPFRTDGQDPLSVFEAEIEKDMIGVAGFDEVLEAGRIVPTRFELAAQEFERRLGEDAVREIEDSFAALIADQKSIDQASQGAFARFFRAEAPPTDAKIAELILSAAAEIWRTRAARAAIAMVHCDCVAFSSRLAERLARETLPDGHPRAGRAPAVAWIVAGEARIFIDGEQKAPADLGWTRTGLRESILEAARQGQFDVLVNVSALGVGTDIPATDLNILACRQRSIGPLKQISGRGERVYPGKTSQAFVDIGDSVVSVFSDIDAMRRGAPQNARRQIRELPEIVRNQFEAWFDSDPALAAKVRARIDDKRRTRRQAVELADVDDTITPNEATPPEYFAIAPGLEAAMNAKKIKTNVYAHRYGLVLDLARSRLIRADSAAPAFLAVFVNDDTGLSQAFLAKTREKADAFLAFMGLNGRPQWKRGRDTPATVGQTNYLDKLLNSPVARIGGMPDCAPASSRTATLAISLLSKPNTRNLDGRPEIPPASSPAPLPILMAMLVSGAERLVARALQNEALGPTFKSLVLDDPNRIDAARIDLIAAATNLRERIHSAAPQAAPPRLAVSTYDPTVSPDIADAFHGKLVVIASERAESLKDHLARAIAAGSVHALSPEGDADDALRLRAGLPKASAAQKNRADRFASLFQVLAPEGKFQINLRQREDFAKALAGKKNAAPIGAFAAALTELAGISPDEILASKATAIVIEAIPTEAPLKFARLKPKRQDAFLDAAERLVAFRAKLAEISPPSSTETTGKLAKSA